MTNSKPKRRGRSRRERNVDHGDTLVARFFSTPASEGRGSREKTRTKSLQLCRQVQRRLDLALSELDDETLCGLWVDRVVAQPGGRTLLVHVSGSYSVSMAELLSRLERARGHLRSEVAAAIHRKRTPNLQFVVMPPWDPSGPEEGGPR